jgi:hypothetical protein
MYFSATEEGALWAGNVDANGRLVTYGYEIVSGDSLASALCMSNNNLAVTAYNLREFVYSGVGERD